MATATIIGESVGTSAINKMSQIKKSLKLTTQYGSGRVWRAVFLDRAIGHHSS